MGATLEALKKNTKRLSYYYDELPAKEREGITGIDAVDNVIGGFISSAARSVGDDLYFANAKDTGKAFNKWSDELDKDLPERIPASDTWNYLTSSAGLPRATAEMAGFWAPSLIPAAFTGGSSLAAKVLTSIPKAARYPTIAKLFATGVLSTPFDAAAEAGRTQRENEEAGMNPELASQKAWTQFGDNIKALTLSNGLQMAAMGPILGKGTSLARRALWAGAEGTSQVIEEGIQKAFENEAKGQDYTYNPYKMVTDPKYSDQALEMQEAAGPVAVISALTGGIGAYRGRTAKQEQAETEEERKQRLMDMYNRVSEAGKLASQNAAASSNNNIAPPQQNSSAGNPNLRNWAHKITGGKMSDEVYNKIIASADKNGVDRKLALALATAENNGLQEPVSDAGAIGVMQLMPETAKALGVDPYNIDQNIDGGIRFLKQQLDAFGGDWRKAAAAYNAGPGAVQKYGGIPPYGETQAYVAKIGGFLNSAPSGDVQSQQAPTQAQAQPIRQQGSFEDFLSNAGQYNGKYWKTQQGDYTLKGLRPETLKAIDLLGEWYYNKTGKKLIVTSGTSGDHPSNGTEHGHSSGWKVDINDNDPADQSGLGLLTATGEWGINQPKGKLTDELIAYGESLGLGMNWEGNHIDVSAYGHKWNENGRNVNKN